MFCDNGITAGSTAISVYSRTAFFSRFFIGALFSLSPSFPGGARSARSALKRGLAARYVEGLRGNCGLPRLSFLSGTAVNGEAAVSADGQVVAFDGGRADVSFQDYGTGDLDGHLLRNIPVDTSAVGGKAAFAFIERIAVER